MSKQTQPKKTTAPTQKTLDKAKMSALDPKNKAKAAENSNSFVLVDIRAQKVLDWDHKPLQTPLFGSFREIYSKLWTNYKPLDGGCQAVLMDSNGHLSYTRNTSGQSDSEAAGQHSEETLFLEANVNSFEVQAILITIEPCYPADGTPRYPGHNCQAFFREGRKLPTATGPLRSFTPSAANTPIFFLELQPLREQTSTTSRFLKVLPPLSAMEWLSTAAGPAYGTVLAPIPKTLDEKADRRLQVIGQEYMEAPDIHAALTRDRPHQVYSINSFSRWNPTTCDAAVQAAVEKLFSQEAAPLGASQSSGYNQVAGTAGAVVMGAFAKGYGLT